MEPTVIKAVALLARKPGSTHAEFAAYYENNHAKLIRRLLPQIIEYRRNYLDLDSLAGAPDAPTPDFDVITEFTFASRADYDAMLATHAQPEVKAAIEADEANFIDRSRSRMYLVDLHES